MKIAVTMYLANGLEYANTTDEFLGIDDALGAHSRVIRDAGTIAWLAPDGSTHLIAALQICAVRFAEVE